MVREVIFKEQGDGRDSWIINYWADETKTVKEKLSEIAYEDPNQQTGLDISQVDIDSLTDSQINSLRTRINES